MASHEGGPSPTDIITMRNNRVKQQAALAEFVKKCEKADARNSKHYSSETEAERMKELLKIMADHPCPAIPAEKEPLPEEAKPLLRRVNAAMIALKDDVDSLPKREEWRLAVVALGDVVNPNKTPRDGSVRTETGAQLGVRMLEIANTRLAAAAKMWDEDGKSIPVGSNGSGKLEKISFGESDDSEDDDDESEDEGETSDDEFSGKGGYTEEGERKWTMKR